MYLKRYVFQRGDKRYAYLRFVEAYRDEAKKVRHRVLFTLGREDQLKASGQLDQLAGAFARLDPPMLGTRREVGPLLLVRHYLERLGLVELVDRALPQRGRSMLTHGEVVAALVANRLSAPSPLYDVAGWGFQAALAELLHIPAMLLNDDRLGRTLDALAPVAEQLRGAVTLAAIERFGVDASRLHLDLTTLRFAGAYEASALVTKGWGPDRRVARQVRALAATTAEGVSLYLRPHPGAAAELTVLGTALERLRELLPPGVLVCADSAFGHLHTLCAADRAGTRFVVPLRETTGFVDRFLREVGWEALRPIHYVAARQRSLPAERRTQYRGVLRDLEVAGEGCTLRVAYIWSSEEARSVADARERALAKAEQVLTAVQHGLGGRYYRTQAAVDAKVASLPAVTRGLLVVETGSHDGRPTLRWHQDEAAITRAACSDGIYALATNLPGPLTAEAVLRLYKGQPVVERRHHEAKSVLRVRPVFLHNDDRIAALVSVVGLALLVFSLVEADIRRRLGPEEELPGLLPEGRAARPTGRTILGAFQGFGLTYTQQGIQLDRLTATQQRLLDLLGIPLPFPTAGR